MKDFLFLAMLNLGQEKKNNNVGDHFEKWKRIWLLKKNKSAKYKMSLHTIVTIQYYSKYHPTEHHGC